MLFTVTLLATLAGGIETIETPAAPPELKLHPVEEQIVALTNAERGRYGLPAMVIDPQLLGSARQHAAWMTNARSMTHTRQSVAENIAMGQSSPQEALRSWMASSGHRANILNPAHRRIGVAAYVTPEGTIYWCQQFQP